MRKRRVPLGWPRRDPRHYRFAVPNKVWEYKLRPTEFLIFSYLCYRQTHGREEKVVSAQVVADSLHLTVATVEKHLSALASKGLVTEGRALTLKCEAGKFFSLPNEVFLLALPPSAFLVYAYLLYCEDRHTHQCHPSYRTIAGTTCLSLNTVVKSVSILAEKSLITVERSCWFNEAGLKRNGNNVYTVLPIREAVENYYQQQLRRLELDAQHRRRSNDKRTTPAVPPQRPRVALPAIQRGKAPPGPVRGAKGPFGGKAGERLGVASAPSRPQPPAVRAVPGQRKGVPADRKMGKVGS